MPCEFRLSTYAKNFSKMPGQGVDEVLAGSFKFSRSCFFKATSGFKHWGSSVDSFGSSPTRHCDSANQVLQGAGCNLDRVTHVRVPLLWNP